MFRQNLNKAVPNGFNIPFTLRSSRASSFFILLSPFNNVTPNMRKVALLFILLLPCLFLKAQQQYPVHFSWGTVFFPDNATAFFNQPDVDPNELVRQTFVRYVQFETLPGKQARREMEAQGVRFLGYVQVNTYLVSLPYPLSASAWAPYRVRSIVPVNPDWKLAKTLREKPYGTWAVDGAGLRIHVQFYPHMPFDEALTSIESEGVIILNKGRENGFSTVLVPENDLLRVAALPYVQSMELLPPPGKPEDINGRSIHRSNLLDSDSPMGKKYNGEGVGMLVRDDGVVGPHIDFAGRLFNLTNSQTGTHGDGVAGIMGGSGNLNPANKGMASGADVYILNYDFSFQDQTLDLHISNNVKVTNSSYSDGCNQGYSFAAQTVDDQLFSFPTLMHVFSAGNSNSQNCGYGAGDQWGNITGGHKMAKNAIATANLNANSALENSSSRGPADDGRIKPDIAAHGQGQISTDPNNAYQTFGGTSGAAPGIAGCFAQLFHAYKNLHSGQEPPAGLLKAAMLNTANDLGNAGPDFKFGWGHVNAGRALETLENNTWIKGQVDQAGSVNHTLAIPQGTRRIRVMLLWVDPPASTFAATALVNDLDIQITDPTGATQLPWLLNSTPNPALLDAPAVKGRDALNNMEQVLIDNPPAGVYSVNVSGFSVPEGPQEYFLVWYMEDDRVSLTYPAGGEALVSGQSLRMHWDAWSENGDFTLAYSTDGGQSYLPISTQTGEKRAFNWQVPNTISGQVHFLLQRGAQSDTTDFACSISPVPANLKVQRVCPDSMTVSFSKINDTLACNLYLLGEKYMEIKGKSAAGAAELTIPIEDPHLEKWIAAGAVHPNGFAGRRSNAIQYNGGLLNCPQPDNINVVKLLSPGTDAVVSCAPQQKPVTVLVRNEGTNPISGARLYQQVGNQPIIFEQLPVIPADSVLEFTFATPVTLTGNGNLNMRIWADFAQEDYPYNDSLNLLLPVVTTVEDQYFTENLDGFAFPPTGWIAGNPDGAITWASTPNGFNIIGASGQPTRATYLECYNYAARGQEDNLYMPPLDLSQVNDPALIFALAYAPISGAYVDGLRVEVFPNCDISAEPIVLWSKSGTELGTTNSSSAQFYPNSQDDWRLELIDLKDFAGQQIIVRFVGENDYGNNIFLDDIAFTSSVIAPPLAAIEAASDTVCRYEPLEFRAVPQAGNSTFSWSFGAFADPGTAVGPGPHYVTFNTPGTRTVVLEINNPAGSDTAQLKVFARNAPVANFNATTAGVSVTLSNTSANADAYLWDFGDSNFSTDKNPTHVYTNPGTYTVTLEATSPCGVTTKTKDISLTVGVQDISDLLVLRILPNPNDGAFSVYLSGGLRGQAVMTLLDVQGRLIHQMNATLAGTETVVPYTGLSLSKGLYQLQVVTDEGWAAYPVVVW